MISKKIKYYMASHGIASVPELSRLSGIPATTIYGLIEDKTIRPNTSTIERLANYFNVKVSDFIQNEKGGYIDKTSFASTSELLSYLMEDIHLTERELARRTGVSQQTINKIVSGKTEKPNHATLVPLANFFRLTLEELRAEKSLDPQREKGVYNKVKITNEKIPHISWEQLYLLPDALQAPLYGHYEYIDRYNIFAVSVPYDIDITDSKPMIKENDILIIEQQKYKKGDLILCLLGLKIVIGNLAVKNETKRLLPPNLSAMPIKLIDGEFKYIGKIVKVINK